MAPRKRTTTEKSEAAPSLGSKVEAKPKAEKTVAKKAVKVEAKTKPESVKKALPELIPTAPKAAPQARKKATPLAKKTVAVKATAEEPAPEKATSIPVHEAKPTAPKKASVAKSEPTFTPNAQKVMEAIAQGRAIELIFVDGDANPPRTFEARQLIFDVFTGSWFAWGWDRRYNAERHHCLDLLAEINPVEGAGRSAQGPYPEGTPANQIGGWRGGEPIPVKAVLQKQWIFAVKQSPAPFPDFQLEDIEDGKAQVTFTGTDLRAIARWCMQFGDGILVLEPQRLVDRIKQVGTSWAGKTAQTPAPLPPKAQPRPEPRQEPRHEPRPEPRHESRPEPRHETRRPEAPRKEYRENREAKETEAPKGKPGRVEIRIERL